MSKGNPIAQLVAAGISLVLLGFGTLNYAEPVNTSWREGWLWIAQKPPPFDLADANLGIWGIILGFCLFVVAYFLNK